MPAMRRGRVEGPPMHRFICICSIFQGILALTALVAASVDGASDSIEVVPVVLSLFGVVWTLIVLIPGNVPRGRFVVAGIIHASAIAAWFLIPLVLGGEYLEGLG